MSGKVTLVTRADTREGLTGPDVTPHYVSAVGNVPAKVVGNTGHVLCHVFEVDVVVEGAEEQDESVYDCLGFAGRNSAKVDGRILETASQALDWLVDIEDEAGQRVIGRRRRRLRRAIAKFRPVRKCHVEIPRRRHCGALEEKFREKTGLY